MTHAEQIVRAAAALVYHEGKPVFTREMIRQYIGVEREGWMAGYTAIFQAMRVDHPGGAPPIGERWRGVFRRVAHGEYVLTGRGRDLVRELGPGSARPRPADQRSSCRSSHIPRRTRMARPHDHGDTNLTIAGIVGSPHKNGMTARLVRRALEGAAAAGAETETFYLADQDLQACRGCGGDCWDTLACRRDPASTAWQARLQGADGLVMAVPVYCWQLNGLTALFIDRMRWDTGSVLHPRNPRVAFGIACAGGSGTGCVLALQALYRYFYNWAFHGISPLPVTRFNYDRALEEARQAGEHLVHTLRAGVQPFPSLGAAMVHYEALPHMRDTPLDELRLIVEQLKEGFPRSGDPLVGTLHAESEEAEGALLQGDRARAAEHLSNAYEAGNRAWREHR